jgi:hypothetical protein
MHRPARVVVIAFVLWKVVGTVLLSLTVQRWIPEWEGANVLRESTEPLRAFRNWDAAYYLRVASEGYEQPKTRAFYPLFPMIVRGALAVVGDPVVAGLIVTTLASSLFALVYYRSAARRLSEREAAYAFLALIAAPSAFFLNCIYTEALFLLLLFLFFERFFARSWGAAPLAALLMLTRGQGLFVGFAVALILLGELPAIRRAGDWSRAAYLLGIGASFVAALVGFMAYQYRAYGDPLAFIHVQAGFFGDFDLSLANSFEPSHVLSVLFTPPMDLNGPRHGVLDALAIWASIALAPAVWRLDRRLFAFYACLAYFPATMGEGGSYLRHFLLPYAIAALALAHAYDARTTILGLPKRWVAVAALALGFASQAGLSLLHASFRWVG